nr:AIG1-like protein [Tanacetum cinerariifolium]
MDSKDDITSLSGSSNTLNDNKKTVNIVDTDDENEGFASGQDEPFETDTYNSLLPLVKDTNVKDDVEETFSEAKPDLDDDENQPKISDKVQENVESNKLGEKILDKVVESDKLESKNLEDKVVESDKLESKNPEDKVVESDKLESKNPEDKVVENVENDKLGSDNVAENESKILDEVVKSSEGDKVVESDKLGENLSESKEGEVVVENGVKVTNEGDSVVEDIKVDVATADSGVAVVIKKPDEVVDKVVDEVEEEDDDEDEDVLLVGGPDDDEEEEVVGGDDDDVKVTEKTVVESPKVESDVKVVESRDLGFDGVSDVNVTPEGDSVVESMDVDLAKPGLAGVAVKDVKGTSEEDSVVEAVDVDLPVAGVAGVAVVMKTEEEGGDLAVDDAEKMDRVLEEVVDKEVVGVTDGKFSPLGDVEVEDSSNKNKPIAEPEVEKVVDSEGVENASATFKMTVGDAEDMSVAGLEDVASQATDDNGPADKFVLEEAAEKDDDNEEGYDGTPSDEEETDGVVFGSSEAAKQFMEELEGGSSNTGGENSQDRSQMMDGQIVTDSDEEDDDDEEDGKEIFDSAALAALLKAAADGGTEGGNITFSSQDGSRLFSVERPQGLGPALQAMRAAPRPPRSSMFNGSALPVTETDPNLTEEERKKLEKLQAIRVKFLRLIQRLGLSTDESVAAQVLYRLALVGGRQTGQAFSLDAAKQKAAELEAEGSDDLDFGLNILVIGKAGVGKSATINSIFGEDKTSISAFQPATGSVKEISGMVGGVPIRVFDTPGLKSSIMEQGYNRSVLASAKKFTKKNPP